MSDVKGPPQCDISRCDQNMFYITNAARNALQDAGRTADVPKMEKMLEAVQKDRQASHRADMLKVIRKFVTLIGDAG